MEFPNTFDGSDTTISDRLHAERAAIAGKLLRRAAANAFTIRSSEPGNRAKATFAKRSDVVRSWLDETEKTGFVERKDAYADYRVWLEESGGKHPLTRFKFFERVAAVLGSAKKRQGFLGWELTPAMEPTLPPEGQLCPQFAPNFAPARAASTSEEAPQGAKGAEFLKELLICRQSDGPVADPFAANSERSEDG